LETGDSVVHGGGYEILAQRKDGGNFPVEFSISEVGHSGLFTGIMRDVTRRKELEKEVMEASAAEARRIGHELHEGFQQEMVTGITRLHHGGTDEQYCPHTSRG
jgi:hypothetical protein